MMSRVRKMIGGRQNSNGFTSYLNSLRRHGDNFGPTYDEARTDFANMVGGYRYR